MSAIIEFKNTSFGYNNTNTFMDFNMEIEEGDIVNLIGPSGSGKTTLLKMLCHQLPNDTCYYRGCPFRDYSNEELKRDIIVIFDLPFKTGNVKDEIVQYLRYLNVSETEINDRYDNLNEIFGLDDLEGIGLNMLSHESQYLIKILRFLIIKPSFLAIDNMLSNLKVEDKQKIIDYIKENKITLLNVTNDLDEAMFGNKLFVLENFVLILEGNTMTVLQTDTLLKRLGFKLPLAVSLSIELNNYEVLDKIYENTEDLVAALWK